MNRKKMLAIGMMGMAFGLAVLSAVAEEKKAIEEKGDSAFARKASAGGLAEVNFSELAVRFARDPAVRQFAQHMIAEHMRANQALTQLANRRSIALAATMDDDHQKLYDKLKKLDGAEFDRTYMEAMVKDHEKAVKLFEEESKNGKDDAMKDLAGKLTPKLREHLAKAREVCKKVKGDKEKD